MLKAEIHVLEELSGLLQGCRSPEETHLQVARSCEQLFPEHSGWLSIARGPHRYESVALWGDLASETISFAAADCWGLTRGRPHVSDLHDPRCGHLEACPGRGCLCAPVRDAGQDIGVLHVVRPAGAVEFDDPVLRRSRIVSRNLGLALSNLRLQADLRDLSVRDPLTGLFHHRYFEETLDRELARVTWSGTSVGLIRVDVDGFDRIVGTFGREAGDAILMAVSGVLVRSSRASDVASRLGLATFALLLPDAPPDATGARAELLRQRVQGLRIRDRHAELPSVTLSCAVASGPGDGADAWSLLGATRRALA